MKKICIMFIILTAILAYHRPADASGTDHTIMLTRTLYQEMSGYDPDATDIIIPEVYYSADGSDVDGYTITAIGPMAFQYNSKIVSITVPGTVKEIGRYCFRECTNLTNVFLSEGLEILGFGAFHQCSSLAGISIPSTLTEIGDYCFDGCSSMEYAIMQEGITTIGKAAFQLCSSLKEINIPDSVEFIGNYAFNHISSARNSVITLPSSLKLLGENSKYPAHMFYNCGMEDTFVSFEISEDNEAYDVIDGILYTEGGKTLVSIPKGKTFENDTYIMPDSVMNLGELSFSRNTNIKKVVISDNLILQSDQTEEARSYYLNNGNDLAIACYAYSGVKEYDVKDTNENYISIDGILYTKDGKELVAIPSEYEGDIIIPDGVERIADGAIWNEIHDHFVGLCFDKVTSIYIPASVVSIPEKQIKSLNHLIEDYGIEVTISSENPAYAVVDGVVQII